MVDVELTRLLAFAGIGVTLALAALAAAIVFGRLPQRVTHVETGIGEVRAEIATLRAETKQDFADLRTEMREEIAALRAETQRGFAEMRAEMSAMRVELERTNRFLAALGNHRHDTDGEIMFTPPQP